jgi:hypothetical protein
MTLKHSLLLIFCLGVLFPNIGQAQISQGGQPMRLSTLKSSRNKVVVMPPIKNFLSVENYTEIPVSGNLLKPFQFAHPFDVDLSPSNSGEWILANNGFYVWRLTIHSTEAKSLNLIFDDFNIPENARLFIISETDNQILGAFTNANNKPSGKFAVSPIAGDEITVQYEVPEKYLNEKSFRIINVNHDYIGILKTGDRRPLGKTAGECNIDINCDDWEDWSDVKNAVCRLIVKGKRICSGVLINNTAENQKPYVLSAAHCYDQNDYPDLTIYTFNYESPFCAPLDGDPSNSISGAKMKAESDSLDFALVELTVIPPPDYRPYYAGWNRSSNIPASTASIHHPQGDIKKISFDNNPPVISSFGEPNSIDKDYIKKGFLRVNRWEFGTTESGSSGGALFDTDKNVIGTLTGGEATCANSVYDYFERFSNAWNYKSDTAQQLKYWLDPLNTGAEFLNGVQFNEGENLCGAFSNLTDNDKYQLVPISGTNSFSGYWGGSNNMGITEFVERFSIEGNEILSGVSFGVGSLKNVLKSSESEILIKIYSGNQFPDKLIFSQLAKINSFAANAMNYVGFHELVEPKGSFFVGFELSNIQALDSFVVYQSLRTASDINTFYFKQNGNWNSFKDSNPEKKSMANIFEVMACNIDDFGTDTPIVDNPVDILIFPNPSNSKVSFEAGQEIPDNSITVFNVLGQKTKIEITKIDERKVEIDLTGNTPGVYFLRFDAGEQIISRKISFVPF